MSAIRQIVIGTAGHIDHGKSQLVRTLTGIDPDRLKEEKERGITIDLGFANLILPDGTRLGFVDVPGHERFVKNMLAGVGGIDLVVLVVAADESIKPQTREHFDICRLLRIPRGVIALTKVDLVDDDRLERVRREVRAFVAGSFLDGAPLIGVSARTLAGIDDLKAALGRLAAEVPRRPAEGIVRLPIDRSFSMRGFGTVITGTLIAGTLKEGAEISILPGGRAARVRRIESFHAPAEVALPGQRTAINLQGVEAAAISRGDVLSEPRVLEPSSLLDVIIELLGTEAPGLKDLMRVRFHHGTFETLARVKLLEPSGGAGFAQLRLDRPTAALPGDRFILRRASPVATLGGGLILHGAPPKLRPSAPGARARFERLAEPGGSGLLRVLVDEGGGQGITTPVLRARSGLGVEAVRLGLAPAVAAREVVALSTTPIRYVAAAVYRDLSDRLLQTLEAFHRKEPLRDGFAKEELRARLFAHGHPEVFRAVVAELMRSGRLRADRERLALATHTVALKPREALLLENIEACFERAGSNPPDPGQVAEMLKAEPREVERLFHLLVGRGRLVRIQDGRAFHVKALEDLKRRLWEAGAKNPVIEIAAFKDLSGTTRKNAIPLLEYFDQIRVTRREGNRRVILSPRGPSAPAN